MARLVRCRHRKAAAPVTGTLFRRLLRELRFYPRGYLLHLTISRSTIFLLAFLYPFSLSLPLFFFFFVFAFFWKIEPIFPLEFLIQFLRIFDTVHFRV